MEIECAAGVLTPERRKRSRNGAPKPQSHKRTVIKTSIVKGIAYTNCKGNEVPKRAVGEICSCRNNCFLIMTQDDQKTLFEKFYSYETSIEQDIFLSGLIQSSSVQRRRSREQRTTSAKPKAASFTYFLPINNNNKKVCKKTFLNAFGLKDGRIRRLQSLVQQGKIPKRKNLGNENHATPEEIVDLIKYHIRSFPTHEAHYSNKTYTYLNATLNIKRLHRLFKTKYPGYDVKYKLYYCIFKQHFDLHFGRPQVDTCITCEEVNVKITNSHASESAKNVAERDLAVHKQRAKKFYECIKKSTQLCKERDDMTAICFDFMQNLALPHIPIQDIFYMRQLWVNVFCVHNLKTGKSVCYVYHEGIAKKGLNDVCSMLYDYVKNEIPSTIKYLRLFSDGCTGQNKNHTIIRFCAALVDTGRFKNVRQYFPVRGHSYNPCDRDFGTLERSLRKFDRLYDPIEYVALIVNAVEVSGRIEVKYLVTNDIFLNFKAWWPKYYLKGGVSEETKGRSISRAQNVVFHPTEYKEIRHSASRSGFIQALNHINGFPVHTFKLLLPSRVTFPLEKAYNGVNPINAKKNTRHISPNAVHTKYT